MSGAMYQNLLAFARLQQAMQAQMQQQAPPQQYQPAAFSQGYGGAPQSGDTTPQEEMQMLQAMIRKQQPIRQRSWMETLDQNRPADAAADPRMVVQPPVDPGYAMPNASVGNLNQTPGIDVMGWLRAMMQQQAPQQGYGQ